MYFAEYCGIYEKPELEKAWRIIDADDDTALTNGDIDISFSRKIDCELACKSLNEAIAEGEDVFEMSDERFGFLLTRYLQW